MKVAAGVLIVCSRLWGAADPSAAVQIQMRNVAFLHPAGASIEIRHARGELKPLLAGEPVTFDKPASFSMHVQTGEIAMTAANLDILLNRYVFAEKDSPVRNVRTEFIGNRIRQKGTLHKGINLPFEIEGSISRTQDGKIRLHADKVKSAHVPVKGLLHMFGEDLAKLVNIRDARGLRTEGDDFILDPPRMTPAPRIEGSLKSVRIEGDRLIQVYGSAAPVKDLVPPRSVKNYIYHRGGTLRFGKLTMVDTDLELIDQGQGRMFEFDLAHYNRQLVAGYSKNTPTQGLLVYMPGYGRVRGSQ